MPLSSGLGSVKVNMNELMNSPIQSPARAKAIRTIARKHGISTKEARFKQAIAISAAKAREGGVKHKLSPKQINNALN